MMRDLHTPVRCGIILAGGEGKRLQPFVRRLRGDILPKQYVNFTGSRSMLEHTFQRAEKLIPSKRLFTVINRDHLHHPEVRRQLSSRPPSTVVVQPVNKETGPGILLPLMHVLKRYPGATVVVFPADHFIWEEDMFMSHVDLACSLVERHPSYLALLGIQPDALEPEYGYIVPGSRLQHLASSAAREVIRFVEKPEPHAARELLAKGSLWNSMVMSFKVETLLDLVCRATPQMYALFSRILQAIGTAREMDVVKVSYQCMQPVNFSRGLMEAFPTERLLVLPLRGVFWSDWGSEQRILRALQNTGRLGRLHGFSRKSLLGTAAI